MDTIERLDRLQQRIRELEAGKAIDANHINVLLSKARQSEFDREWQHQKQLRKVKKPAALNYYEALHRQAAALMSRCKTAVMTTEPERSALARLQSKCLASLHKTHAEIRAVIGKQPELTKWLDRCLADAVAGVVLLDSRTEEALLENNTALKAAYEQLPILVGSRSADARVTIEQRFGWKAKREIRLELLRTTLAELQDRLVDELEKEQKTRQVRAARVFMDAYFAAAKEGKNTWAAANAALQRNGFEREDVLRRCGRGMRDVEVREMEELLIERFKAMLTQEELEQLRMLEEMDG